MNGPALPTSFLLPLSQASVSQMAQAIARITIALAPYYPAVTSTRWWQLLTMLELELWVTDQQTVVSATGLSTLIQYFEAGKASVGQPPPAAAPAADRRTPQQGIKQTYGIAPEVLKTLARTSYWRRENRSALVNRALTELLARYPESLRPLPDEE